MISIIMPVYNVEKFLNDAILSVINQSYKDFELIIVNDGSTDKSIDVINKFLKDPRIKIINQSNQGLSAARNNGIQYAKFDLITFIDSDDFIHEKYLEIMLNTYKNTGSDIIICNYLSVDEQAIASAFIKRSINQYSKLTTLNSNQSFRLSLSPFMYINMNTAWAKIYKKELFSMIRYPVGKFHEDEFTTYKLLLKSKKITLIEPTLLFYRQRSNSIMKTYSNEKYRNFFESQIEKLLYNKKHNLIIYLIIAKKIEELKINSGVITEIFPKKFLKSIHYFFIRLLSLKIIYNSLTFLTKIYYKILSL